jgi:hypothetical protein
MGFQVPARSFANGTVLASRGVLFACALLGKVTVGILVPNFHSDVDSHPEAVKKYRGLHLKDCLVVGFSMVGEAEFAFVVAVFGVTGVLQNMVVSSCKHAIKGTAESPGSILNSKARALLADADIKITKYIIIKTNFEKSKRSIGWEQQLIKYMKR